METETTLARSQLQAREKLWKLNEGRKMRKRHATERKQKRKTKKKRKKKQKQRGNEANLHSLELWLIFGKKERKKQRNKKE